MPSPAPGEVEQGADKVAGNARQEVSKSTDSPSTGAEVVGMYPRSATSVAVAEVNEVSEDRAQGEWDETKGVIKEQAGKITGDRSREVSGKLDQAKGKLEKKIGDAKDTVPDERDPKR